MPIDMHEDVVITLKAHEWQIVLNALTEVQFPWRMINPLIENLRRQFDELDGRLNLPMPEPASRRVNGSARAE